MRSSPERASAAGFAAAVGLAALLLAPHAGRSYVDGPPAAHTGGFGEPTCAVCHRAGAADAPAGALALVAPATFAPGGEHVLELRLRSPGMRRAGFQLSARFAEGPLAGRQAGELLPAPASRGEIAVVAAHAVSYAGHTAAGAEPERLTDAREEVRWQVRWRAPAGAGASGTVAFHAAANAADYDDSELGDRVYVASAVSRPAAAGVR